MARGKKVDIEEYLTNIEEYLKYGCSLPEACLHGEVPYTTVKDYYDKDETVRKKIDRLKNHAILVARKSVVEDMETDAALALKYLERKVKGEFSTQTNYDHSGDVTIHTITTIMEEIDGESADLPG